jgi:hypothetical protein
MTRILEGSISGSPTIISAIASSPLDDAMALAGGQAKVISLFHHEFLFCRENVIIMCLVTIDGAGMVIRLIGLLNNLELQVTTVSVVRALYYSLYCAALCFLSLH